MEGCADEHLAPDGQDSAECDDAQSDVGKQSLLSLFVVLRLMLVLQREGFHRPYMYRGLMGVVVTSVVIAALQFKIFATSVASAGCTGTSTGTSEGTGSVGEVQSRFRADGSLVVRHGGGGIFV